MTNNQYQDVRKREEEWLSIYPKSNMSHSKIKETEFIIRKLLERNKRLEQETLRSNDICYLCENDEKPASCLSADCCQHENFMFRYLMDSVQCANKEVKRLEMECECNRIQAVDRGNSFAAQESEIARYKEALKEIIAVGESGINFPQDGRMSDIAAAALAG